MPKKTRNRKRLPLVQRMNHYDVMPNGCWEWNRGRDGNNYGRINVEGHYRGSHRVAAHVWLGFDLASPLEVLHKCDNPPCINPDHLFIGTQSDNLKDCVAKGRWKTPWKVRSRGGYASEQTKLKMRESRLRWLAAHPEYRKEFGKKYGGKWRQNKAQPMAPSLT